MNFPYNKPVRMPSDQGGSVRERIPYIQYGKFVAPAASAMNTLWIPCDIRDPWNLFITPMDTTTQALLFPATGAYHLNDMDLEPAASVIADTDYDWATGTAYVVGNLVNDADDDQYICVVAHTASDTATGFASDLAKGYWQLIDPDYGYLHVTFKSVSGSVLDINYKIEGYQ